MTTAGEHPDASTRKRAEEKAAKWVAIFSRMVDGTLSVGSRTPLADVPKWATLEVATGGFATGELLAGGPLLEHEKALASKHQLEVAEGDRTALNRFFLTDEGLSELHSLLESGKFDVSVPEEGALLVVAWLGSNGHGDQARNLLDAVAPYFGRLRFYPEPTERPRRFGSRVCVQDVTRTIRSLRSIKPNRAIAAQKEAIAVWAPLYDELVDLFLETMDGEPPKLQPETNSGSRQTAEGQAVVIGGWPCKVFPEMWTERATDLLRRFERLQQEHQLSSKPTHRKSSLAQLMPFLSRCVADPALLSGCEVGRIRLLLARYINKRGLPDSTRCRSLRGLQEQQAKTPIYNEVAGTVVARLFAYPGNEGIEDLAAVTEPISAEEASHCGLDAGSDLPDTIRRRIERCLTESVEVLVERGLIPSGDVLAEVLPQLTSGLRAAGIDDPQLRQLYAATYRAFRRRRSLLLLDLQSQVRIEELPWVAALESFRTDDLPAQQLARQTLEEVACLTLTSFPHAIVPNKLLQELRALAKGAGVELPLVDELAADIFMGEFSEKFVKTARLAAEFLDSTLYATYYGIDCEQIRQLPKPSRKRSRSWFYNTTPTLDAFADLCCKRAGVRYGGWDSAINGMIIEQQQVLTTQNLASLFSGLGLAETLRPQLSSMARHCFEWICRRQQINESLWHARLITMKNTAYAWRQMVFFLSFVGDAELTEFVAWAESHLSIQQPEFQVRFRPAMDGLVHAIGGCTPFGVDENLSDGRQFLGWSKSRHWLLA
ncbi:hypothetical protein [Pseudobythopirellula maris]|uniref:hypothetical protein n=1 Tax=Pseudobythopirellula maris TaxID=2527991 RepID=UPI0011B3CC27|nr:hypothetical protein [Pseudobythopirellula maris]